MKKRTKPDKKRTKKIDIDSILVSLLVVLLIVISLISVVILRDYVGLVSYHAAKGGVITELNVYQVFPASMWSGIVGIALESPLLNTTWFVYADPADISELNPIFICLEPGKEHEIYATTMNFTQINWSNIEAGTTQMVDDFTGTAYNQTTSATQTFTNTMTVEVGGNTIIDVPMAYMYRYNNQSSTAFPVGILQDNGNIIMVTLINNDFLVGYRPDKIYNYEMMVPMPINTSNYRYNIFTDPFDDCPEGQEGEYFEPGSVYGWVTDNDTQTFLENVLVAVERKFFITGPDGFYNITDLQPGNYYLVALKAGFNNYVGNITIEESEATLHNISMVFYEEPLTGTGPGVGTGVGPGEDPPGTETETGEGPGVGPGVGPGIGPFFEKPEEPGLDHWVSLEKLQKKIRLDTFFRETILVFSFRPGSSNVQFQITGNASEIIEMSDFSAIIEQNEYANISIRGFGIAEGVYTGAFEVSGDFNDTIPIEISVLGEDKLPIEALLVELEILTRRPLPGNNFRFKIDLQNLLIEDHYDVMLEYFIRGVQAETANNTLYVGNDTVSIITTETIIKDVLIPPEWETGDYYLIVEANYLDLYSRTSTVFELFEPFYNYKVFGLLEVWKLLLILSILALIIGTILYIRHRIYASKRFHVKVEYKLLPQKGPRSLYVGKIAETENDTYFDMDKLTVHSIVAGSTGGGKTIAAQVIVEEALLKEVAVIVFDPTAQWSGMLRKCQDEKMMSFYPRFHLTKKDAKAFNGNVRAIKNPREKIQLEKYWKPGEIQVFTLSTLSPKDMDIFVANTVRAVFQSNLQEFRGLRYMMVYDEVHRLLPKFGGSGEGFIQIERACREFRKWGIGVMLVSQVLADFVGQIKANINTEVQMKTRDEGDLNRIKTKYGESFIQELVKSPVGSGMVQNSSWNRGKPYYVTFRPIIHSVVRLTDEELEKYNKYNEIVEDLAYQLDQIEQEGKDVFDLRLELKLSLDKIKQGAFNMVEIYLEGLRPRIEKIWKELGKTPKKKQIELVSEAELQASIQAAQKESDKAKSTEAAAGAGGEPAAKKKMAITDDVPPDKLLNLANGMLVNKLKNLVDELRAMKDDDFKKQVNEEKNDYSAWIRTSYQNDKWADIADQILTREDFIKFLELLEQGKEKTFKPATPRPKPFSSKAGQPAAQLQPAAKAESAPTAAQPQTSAPQQSAQPAPAAQPSVVQQPAKPVPAAQTLAAKPATPATPPPAKSPPPVSSTPQQTATQAAKGLNWSEIKQKLAQLKTSPEKINYLKGLEKQFPNNPELLFSIAAEYHRVKDLANAEAYYLKLSKINPNNAKVLYYLANVYSMEKKYKEALDMYNKIIQIQPNYPKVKNYVAVMQKLVNAPKEANPKK
ncbi:DUF87 domain-containing protein [Candidatus Woesearchaeota archaeon]|nr:DUF87 domain-containing protein [Candidatus Woesearchaeota archaeon]